MPTQRHVRKALRKLRKSRVAVVGVARNCGRWLRNDIDRLREAVADFKMVSFVVVESDSTDDTLAVLEELARTIPNFTYQSMGALVPDYPARTDRLALCRNRYLEILRGPDFAGRLDYVIVADLDGCNDALTPQGLRSCWEADVNWTVCTANQAEYYFDIWALRHDLWCPDDCWKRHKALAPIVGDEAAREICVDSKMIHLDPELDLIEVKSAFGGLGVYKYDALVASSYTGRTKAKLRICEHVPLHEKIRADGGRIFINPALINSAGLKRTQDKKDRMRRELSRVDLRRTFLKIYDRKFWGGPDSDFYSGDGSHAAEVVEAYVSGIHAFLKKQFDTKPDVVDLGCGDFNIGSRIRPDCGRYVACDIVPDLVQRNQRSFADAEVDFRCVDIVNDPLPEGEIVFIRQVLQHLSNSQIAQVVAKLGQYRWAVVTEHLPKGEFTPNVNRQTGKGNRLGIKSGIVLTAPPFEIRPLGEEILCAVPHERGVITTVAYRLKPEG